MKDLCKAGFRGKEKIFFNLYQAFTREHILGVERMYIAKRMEKIPMEKLPVLKWITQNLLNEKATKVSFGTFTLKKKQ
jgi:hypothetical protein